MTTVYTALRTMKMIADKGQVSDAVRVGQFIARYSASLLSSGATTLRTERNVRRVAQRFGYDVLLTMMPLHVDVSIRDNDGQPVCLRSEPCTRGVDFYTITALSRLSWKIADERIGMEQAERMFSYVTSRCRYPLPVVMVAAGGANASFCRLFGGDAWAMFFVLIGTVLGFWLRHSLTSRGLDFRIGTMLSGVISTIIASGSHIFGLGNTADVAVATSVLYLVPGIPYINSFSNFIHGHYVSSLTILLSALEITVCLGVGLLCGTLILNY